MISSIRIACVLSAILMVPALGAGAASRSIIEDSPGGALTAAAVPAVRAKLDKLRGRARDEGNVEIIVGVRAPFAPEGYLSARERVVQRRDIAAYQNRVLRALPAVQSTTRNLTLFNALPFMAMSVTPNELETLVRSADVGYVEEVRYMSLQLASSTGMIGASSSGGAWAQGVTGRGAAVAILDTGVESAHPFLSSGVVSEACFASDGNCPGGVTQSTQPGSGNPCAQWFCNHGTHVAGIAAGNGNIDSGIAGLPTADSGGGALAGVSQATEDSAAASGPGYSGVAPQADIIAINMFRRDGWITTTDMISALGRVYDLRDTYNIAAANMSIGFHVPYYDEASCDAEWASTKAAIDQLRSVGIATVIASGNAGWGNALMAPGCISSSISVGATLRSSDQVAYFSDSSLYLKVLAPGDGIYSSVPGGGYTPMSGTSMATPHVVGAWALMKQKNPDLSVDEGLRILKTTGQPVLDGRNGLYHPRIDIGAALLQIEDTVAPETPTGLRAVAMSSDRIDLSWTFADDNIRVGSYKVYRNGALAAIMQGRVNSYINTGLMPLTQYSYSVAACDEAGNCSAPSGVVTAKTTALSDTTAPSAPPNLNAKVYGTNRIDLIWKSSTDNVAVKNYKVYRDGQLVVTLGKVTSYRQTGLKPGTTYHYAVSACDAAGNCSAQSTVVATTASAGVS